MALTRCTVRVSNVGAPCSPWTIASTLCQDPALIANQKVNPCAKVTSRDGADVEDGDKWRNLQAYGSDAGGVWSGVV